MSSQLPFIRSGVGAASDSRTNQPPAGSDHPLSLIYEPYYGLKEKPFSLSADPRFLYKSRSHAPAFDDLLAAIRRREGLIVLTGDIGTGKTTLCRAVLQHLDRKTFTTFCSRSLSGPRRSAEDARASRPSHAALPMAAFRR